MPFYCGKTVQPPEKRLREHRYAAANRPHGLVGQFVIDCAASIRVHTVEVVPAADDWIQREKHWIAILRKLNPNCANITEGGTGTPGYICKETTKATLRALKTGVPLSAEHREKLSLAKRGKPGRPVFAAEREKRSASQKGRIVSAEHREKLRLANLGKKQSPETIEKRAEKHRGMKRPEGTGAKIRATRIANQVARVSQHA